MWGGARPPVFRSLCSFTGFPLFFLILSHCSSVHGMGSPSPPLFLSLSGFALQSEIESSLVQMLCGSLWVQTVGLGTCETQVYHENTQDLLEALPQACNFVSQFLTQAALALAEDRLTLFSGATVPLSSCLTPRLLPCGSMLVLFLIVRLPHMAVPYGWRRLSWSSLLP